MKREGIKLNKESRPIKPSRIIQRFLASEYLTPPSYFEQIQNNDIICLDKNENPFTPPLGDLASLNPLSLVKNYPDPTANTFLKLLSEKINIPISFLVAGSGSDELLDLIIRIFSSPKNAVLSVSPTFSMYKFYAKINGAKYLSVPLELQLKKQMGIVSQNQERKIPPFDKNKHCEVCCRNDFRYDHTPQEHICPKCKEKGHYGYNCQRYN